MRAGEAAVTGVAVEQRAEQQRAKYRAQRAGKECTQCANRVRSVGAESEAIDRQIYFFFRASGALASV